MLISVLLILCLQSLTFGESSAVEFVKEPKWEWKKACEEHPFAVGKGIAKKDMTDAAIGKRCTLTFEYPLIDSGDSDAAAIQFCQLMFPDTVLDETGLRPEPKTTDSGKRVVTCVYQRPRTCANETTTGNYPISSKCVKIVKDISKNFTEANSTCGAEGYKLLDISQSEDRRVVHFLSRLYSFDQPTQALWVMAKDRDGELQAHLHYMRYSAIGDKPPGATEEAKTDVQKNEKATVVCVKDGDHLPTTKKDYCKMVSSFLKIHAAQIGSTCYSTTQSVMTAKHTGTNKVVAIDHFNDICRARYGDLNFPVAPRSDEQKKALVDAVQARGKRGVLLPASMTAYFDKQKADNITDKEFLASLFAYKIARKHKDPMNVETIEIETMGVNADNLWNAPTYPTKLRMGVVTPGILYWNGNKIENVEQFRRAPIVCGTGPAVVTEYQCPPDFYMAHDTRHARWEMAHRPDGKAICFVVQKGGFGHYGGDCPSYAHGEAACNNLGAELAPMESPEEEMAIARAVAQAYTVQSWGWTGVLLGGTAAQYNHIYTWQMTNQRVGSVYPRYLHGQPDHYKSDGRQEACLELAYFNGRNVGLNDVMCDNSCWSGHTVHAVACARFAKTVDL